jgi:hypothetical protein
MPLPDPAPTRVWAPAWAGVGLRAVLLEQREHRPPADWPPDWWQRNYDLLLEQGDPEPIPFTDRMLRVPGFPYPEPAP